MFLISIGVWPSGKAPVFGIGIRRFESYHPSQKKMLNDVFLSLNNCDFAFGKNKIFDDISLSIHKDDRTAIVGKNGVGKTTLFNIISQKIQIDSGELWTNPAINIGYLNQRERFDKN